MTEISRKDLYKLTAELNEVSASRQELVANAMGKVITELSDDAGYIPEERIADLRNAAIQIMEVACTDATEISAARSAEFYDAVRQLSGVGGGYSSIVDSGRDPKATEEAIRGMVSSVVKTGKADAFLQKLLARVDYETKKASGVCMFRNGRRDKTDVKFARVPSGSETCAFCVMLASRGFVYKNEKTAGANDHWHAHCDCRIVPSFGADPSIIEGYDPEGLYERYRDCARAVADDLNHASQSAVLKEMGRRNPEWLNHGTPGKITQDPKAKPLPKEMQVAEWLTQHGFDIHFRETRETEGKKTSDVLLQDVPWEIKQPCGSGRRNISNQFNEAQGQSDKLIIDTSISPWADKDIEQEVCKQLGLRDDFSELILIKDGYMRRYKKEA